MVLAMQHAERILHWLEKRELQKSKHQKMIQRGLNWDGFLFLQRTRIWSVLL